MPEDQTTRGSFAQKGWNVVGVQAMSAPDDQSFVSAELLDGALAELTALRARLAKIEARRDHWRSRAASARETNVLLLAENRALREFHRHAVTRPVGGPASAPASGAGGDSLSIPALRARVAELEARVQEVIETFELLTRVNPSDFLPQLPKDVY